MALNKQKGNMYGFVTHTWNAIKGRCSHQCEYCYMKPFWKSEVHLDFKELKTILGEGNFIFVGSSTDMWANNVKEGWIIPTLKHCLRYKENIYLFQSKNPKRIYEYYKWLPKHSVIATTIETNRNYPDYMGNSPPPKERAKVMGTFNNQTMVTIEPIMDFDLDEMIKLITYSRPKIVNIGADSKGHNLPEPSPEKIGLLIKELEKFTKVNLKENLKRIYPNE